MNGMAACMQLAKILSNIIAFLGRKCIYVIMFIRACALLHARLIDVDGV